MSVSYTHLGWPVLGLTVTLCAAGPMPCRLFARGRDGKSPPPRDFSMSALICGSLAYDTIMVFPDQFKNHILPDKVHILNV